MTVNAENNLVVQILQAFIDFANQFAELIRNRITDRIRYVNHRCSGLHDGFDR